MYRSYFVNICFTPHSLISKKFDSFWRQLSNTKFCQNISQAFTRCVCAIAVMCQVSTVFQRVKNLRQTGFSFLTIIYRSGCDLKLLECRPSSLDRARSVLRTSVNARMTPRRIMCVGLVCVDVVNLVDRFPVEDTDMRTLDQWR